MKEKMLFIYNPHSGKGQIKNKLMDIVNIFTIAGYEIVIYPTQEKSDAYRLVCESDGRFDCIVCSGGDGTLNEVVSAVLTHNISRPKVGYIPAGSTNDFATTLKIPKDMRKAAVNIATGNILTCDVGEFNGRIFNYVAAFGVFTDIAYSTPQSVKNVLGHQAYLLESMKSIAKMESYHMEITGVQRKIVGDFVYGMITNSESVGGIKGICGPYITLNDGLFEVTLVREPLDAVDLQLIASGLVSRDEENPMVERFKTDSITIKCDNEVAWTLDGENGDSHRCMEFKVIPNAVDIIVPGRK